MESLWIPLGKWCTVGSCQLGASHPCFARAHFADGSSTVSFMVNWCFREYEFENGKILCVPEAPRHSPFAYADI